MLFNTIDFVVFFAVVLGVFVAVKNRKFQHVFLLVSSYFFFYYTSNYLIVLLIYTTVWDYYFGNAIWKSENIGRKKILLIASLAGNLGLLGFFKYYDFAVTQFNILGHYFDLSTNFPMLNLVLPIGISFYTFHSITYTVGIYRGQLNPARSFVNYAIFVTFFPQLVAGPILRAKDFLPQLQEKIHNSNSILLRQISITNSNLKLGVTIMAFGFFKKMFIADNVAPLANTVFSNPLQHDSFTIILGAIAFGIQIYADFSGYSDIAIGAATVMGFKIPVNFNRPYFATSPSDFWHRWHISLSTWLRDYLYIPLGGNKKSRSRTYLNLFIVMFLGGLWHGASWNFAIWGMLHGTYLAIQKAVLYKFPNLNDKKLFNTRKGRILSILLTQYFVFLAWIAFRVKDTTGMFYSMSKYLIWDFQTKETIGFAHSHFLQILFMVVFMVLYLISYKTENFAEKISKFRLRYWGIVLTGIALVILLFFNGRPEDFIYFQF